MAGHRISADLLVPGDGEPVTDGVVVIEGSAITYAGPASEAPETPEALETAVATAMPGLWDCHTHLFGLAEGVVDPEKLMIQTPQLGAVRAGRDLTRALQAGITSVREVGGYGALLAPAVDEGTIVGPTVYAAGSGLSRTGGHGDAHGISPQAADDLYERHFGSPLLADGPDDCRRLVRRQLRMGARIIKVCASGGVMSQIDHPVHQQFSAQELSAVVDEAARADRAVAAHCQGKPAIMAAVEAGVRTIEHGSYLDEEAAAAMAEAGTILVPTRWIFEHLGEAGNRGGTPDYAARKLAAIADRHREAIQIAVSAGVSIAAGTDIWGAGMWGRNGEEPGLLVESGMGPLHAIAAATATAPTTLGPQAPEAGRLAEGCDADVLGVAGDPVSDISILGCPDLVSHVWKGGRLVKDPLAA